MLTKIILEEKITATYKAIKEANEIVIVAHKRPDGDAIGSCLGLYHFLFLLNKKAQVILPDAIPQNMEILPCSQEILNFEKDETLCTHIVEKADLIFCLDFNNLKRIGDLGELIEQQDVKKVMIDHHPNYDNFADIIISHPEVASTSELIFRLICRMGFFADMNVQTAECICAGMLTDTGGLAYNSNSPEIYTIFAELLRKGVDKDALYRHLFNNYSESRMRMMGYVLSEKMEILPEFHTAIISLTDKDLEKFSYEKGDTEGFVNMPLSIKGVIFSIFVRQDGKQAKISLRSQGSFPANTFATEVFGGGGHLNAAGAESLMTIDETIAIIKENLPRYFVDPEASVAEANAEPLQENK